MADLLADLVKTVTNGLKERGLMLVTAESCTGGLIATMMTELPGSSSVFERGFVTYSNDSKEELLDVSREILETYGAVSTQTAEAMVLGSLARSHAQIAVSVTGIAGPSGGTPEKPVGLVYIGWGRVDGPVLTAEHHFPGDRHAIRRQTAETALQHLIQFMEKSS